MSAHPAPIVATGRAPWSFSRGLRATLRDQRFTQSDLARLMGVTPAWVSNRMHARTRWTLRDCATIASAVEVDLVDIMRAGGYPDGSGVANATPELEPHPVKPRSEVQRLMDNARELLKDAE